MSGRLHAPADLPQENDRGTLWIAEWVGSKACLDVLEKIKKTLSMPNLNS
jgi:hypothetical protein